MPEPYSYFPLVNSKVRGSRIFIDPNEHGFGGLNSFYLSPLVELLKSPPAPPPSVWIRKSLLREIRSLSEGTRAVRLVERSSLSPWRGGWGGWKLDLHEIWVSCWFVGKGSPWTRETPQCGAMNSQEMEMFLLLLPPAPMALRSHLASVSLTFLSCSENDVDPVCVRYCSFVFLLFCSAGDFKPFGGIR